MAEITETGGGHKSSIKDIKSSVDEDETHLLPHQREGPVKTQPHPVLYEQDVSRVAQPATIWVPSGKNIEDQSHLPPHLREHPLKLCARMTWMDQNATPVAGAASRSAVEVMPP